MSASTPGAHEVCRACSAAAPRLRRPSRNRQSCPFSDRGNMRLAKLLALLLVLLPGEAVAEPALDALIAAYPDLLSSYTGTELVWTDGSRMPLGDARPNRSFAERLDHAGIRDQFAIRY